MHIYTLDEAYDVILNKLDNLDSKKRKRYEKVYKKLKDFEDYIISLRSRYQLKEEHHKKKIQALSLMMDEEIV